MSAERDSGVPEGPATGRPGTDGLDERVRLITDAVPVLISYVDSRMRYQFNNRQYEDWFGQRPEWLQGRHVREVLGEAAFERVRPHAEAALSGQTVEYEAELPDKDGGTRIVRAHYVPDRRPDGSVAGYYALEHDMTATRRAEQRERERAQHAEAQLRRHSETFFNLVQNSPFGVFVVDADFRLQQVARGAERTFAGVEPLLGRDFAEVLRSIWNEPFASKAIDRFRHTLETGEPYVQSDTTEQRHDRDTVESYDWRVERITLPDGQFGVVCHFYDLTDIRHAQEELRYRSQQFQTLIDRAPLGVLLVDADFRLVQVNPAGMPAFSDIGELPGRSFDEVMHLLWPGARADAISRLVRQTLETGESHHMPELEGRHVDRSVTEYYDWRIDRITLLDGRFGVVCYFRDITASKRAEESIRFQARLLDEVGQAVVVTDPEGRIIYWNRAAEDLYGWTREEAVGRSVLETTVGPDGTDRAAGILEQVRGGQPWSGEFDVRSRTGVRPAIVTNTPLFDEHGILTAIVGVSVDISQLKTVQRALQDADRRKDEFLATLAHELRNPLAAIRMALGVLARGGHDPERVQGIIERQSAQLVRLIDDLLDVSRITRGKVELHRHAVSLAQILEHAVDAIAPTCESTGLRLTVHPTDPTLVVHADPLRFAQVVSNLLNNACKFTPSGGEIVLSAARDGDHAVIQVRDTGIGIPQGELDRVFDMFAQVDGQRHGSGGLGIGLSLARSIVALHGGSIRASSDGPGRGSTFAVRLPALAAAVVPSSPAAPRSEVRARRGTVLAVDDNRDALDAVAMALRTAGYTVETAGDGIEGLERARRVRPGTVLLDIGLPGLDGYEVARRIRRESWGRAVRLVAMTGWGQEKDKQRARDAGFDAHLTKPVDPSDLVRALDERTDTGDGRSGGALPSG